MEHYQGAVTASPGGLRGDPDLAADATQDAFIHAYDHIRSYRGGAFRSWLLRITANASYDILRRAQRRPTTELPDLEAGEPDIADPHALSPSGESVRSELYRALDTALRLLPEEQRTAVVLCDVYGMDYEEVALDHPVPRWARRSRVSIAAGSGCASCWPTGRPAARAAGAGRDGYATSPCPPGTGWSARPPRSPFRRRRTARRRCAAPRGAGAGLVSSARYSSERTDSPDGLNACGSAISGSPASRSGSSVVGRRCARRRMSYEALAVIRRSHERNAPPRYDRMWS